MMNCRFLFVCLGMLVAITACQQRPVEALILPLPPAAEAAVPTGLPVEDEPKLLTTDFTRDYLVAQLAAHDGAVDVAADAYLELVAQQPDHATMLERAINYQLASGNISAAADLSARRAKLPGMIPPVGAMTLVVEAVAEQDWEGALVALFDVQEQLPELLPVRLIEAQLQLATGVASQTTIDYVTDLPTHPSLQPFRVYQLGRLVEIAGDEATAMELYQQAVIEDPHALFALLRLGGLHSANGNVDQAQELYLTYQARNPDTMLVDAMLDGVVNYQAEPISPELNIADILFSFGTLLLADDQPLAGRQFVNLARWLSPELPFATFYMGLMEEQGKRYDAAIDLYATITPQDPSWLLGQVRRALLLQRSEQAAAAQELLRQLKQLHPNVALLHQTAGDLAVARKKYNDARRAYDRAIELTPTPQARHAKLFFARGTVNERLDNITAAEQDLLRAIKLHPTNALSLNYLGYMWADRGENLPQAIALLTQALLLDPSNPAIIDSFGWALFQLGEYDKARQMLERAVELKPDDAIIIGHLGDVYAALGREREAFLQWQRALTIGITEKSDLERIKSAVRALKKD